MEIVCTKCGVSKSPEAFPDFSRKTNGKNSWCHECRAARSRVSPNKNINNINHHRDKKQRMIAHMGGMCRVCGVSGLHPAAYQFHHRNPEEKEFSISLARGRSMERLYVELKKCDLLCANCHAIHHANY